MDGLRVLVAEDESAVALSLATQLGKLGHEVVGEAESGRAAVELAAKVKPDVVLMDIKMPDMDGIEAASLMAEECPVPVVFLSGHFGDELLEGVVEAGGMAYLLKPVLDDQLQAALSLAKQRFGEMKGLREQAERLAEALETRKVVARAKGLVMARRGLTEEEAHRKMQKEASEQNLKLVDLARAILAADAFVGGSCGSERSDSGGAGVGGGGREGTD